jgi:hypothetical protein
MNNYIIKKFAHLGIKNSLIKFSNILWRKFSETTCIYTLDSYQNYLHDYSLPYRYSVKKIITFDQIDDHSYKTLRSNLPPNIVEKVFLSRLNQNLKLWLKFIDNELIGYTWSTTGFSIKNKFYPFSQNDSILYDALIFPQYRGNGYNSIFDKYIICDLFKDGSHRIFIQIKSWNLASISSVKKMGFEVNGCFYNKNFYNFSLSLWIKKQGSQ